MVAVQLHCFTWHDNDLRGGHNSLLLGDGQQIVSEIWMYMYMYKHKLVYNVLRIHHQQLKLRM